jgi:hypothetical protein
LILHPDSNGIPVCSGSIYFRGQKFRIRVLPEGEYLNWCPEEHKKGLFRQFNPERLLILTYFVTIICPDVSGWNVVV